MEKRNRTHPTKRLELVQIRRGVVGLRRQSSGKWTARIVAKALHTSVQVNEPPGSSSQMRAALGITSTGSCERKMRTGTGH